MPQENLLNCSICSDNRVYKGEHGLKIHKSKKHKINLSHNNCSISQDNTNITRTAPTQNNVSEFCKKISKCRQTIPTLKRVPRGARISVAQKLKNYLDNCVTSNTLQNWFNLFNFSYSILHVNNSTGKKRKNTTNAIKVNCSNSPNPFNFTAGKNKPSYDKIKHIESKFFEGDVKGACRLLFSDDTIAENNNQTIEKLRKKHPLINTNFSSPNTSTNSFSLEANVTEVNNAIFSFAAGSSSGFDGLSPQHLKDLCTCEIGHSLLESITKFINFVISGNINNEILPLFFGASLFALNKKDGDIRPIAIGCVLRRLASKVICSKLSNKFNNFLAPFQLGVGTKNGCEAAVHAARSYILSNKSEVFLKIDVKNAFNSFDRNYMLNKVLDFFPEIYNYVWQSYSSPSHLTFSEFLLTSTSGCQQGDPLGPFLFSLTIQSIIQELNAEFNIWYLDDGNIGGSALEILNDTENIIKKFHDIGLNLNTAKCQIYFNKPNPDLLEKFEELLPNIKLLHEENLFLLGSPIFEISIPSFITNMQTLFSENAKKLLKLQVHIALHIIRFCIYVPKFIYFIRSSPIWKFTTLLNNLNIDLKQILEQILNIKLDSNSFDQLSLPIRHGGLGIRKISSLALPAYIASIHASHNLIGNILFPSLNSGFEIIYNTEAIEAWKLNSNTSVLPLKPHIQKQWDEPLISKTKTDLFQNSSTRDKARLLAASEKESGAWLEAFPSPNIGTLLSNSTIRIAVCLRIGAKLCEPHVCHCGINVNPDGHHGLSCIKSTGRYRRHAEINDIIRRSLTTVNIPSILEPNGIFRTDGKRPDGMTLIPWRLGKAMVWDATCVDTVALSHLQGTACQAGSAASTAEVNKHKKYQNLNNIYQFLAFAVETFGPWSKDAKEFYKTLTPLLIDATGDPRAGSHFKQKISIAIQKGNAVSVLSTMP